MKKMMIALLMAAAVASTGCATTGSSSMFGTSPGSETQEQKLDRQAKTKSSARKGFLQGCLGGGIGGLLSGDLSSAVKGCAVGGVITGGISAIVENQRQIKQANELAGEVRSAGGNATVTEKTVQVKDEKTGQVKDVQALERLTIEFPPKSLATKNEMANSIIKKAAVMAAASKTPVEITAYGSTKEEGQWIAIDLYGYIQELPKNPTGGVSVTSAVGDPARLELSPVPQL